VDGVDTPDRIEHFGTLAAKIAVATSGQFAVDQEKVIEEGKRALWEMVELFLQASLDRRKDLAARFARDEVPKEDLPRDMLMTLCLADDLSREDDDEAEIPYVWRQCALFLNASIQTTSHMLPHVFVHLDDWISDHPTDRAKLTDVEFLHLAIAESLRLHQSSPVRFRIATCDLVLSTGRQVKCGEMLALYAPPANLETEIFGGDARYFNPYRETPAGKAAWGMTFGSGPHLCLGRNLVTGVLGRSDEKYGSEGTAVKIVKAFYNWGCQLDPERPPVRNSASYHDAYESVPVILRDL
jgi:cytochrome P450